jgi:hypothetical protein
MRGIEMGDPPLNAFFAPTKLRAMTTPRTVRPAVTQTTNHLLRRDCLFQITGSGLLAKESQVVAGWAETGLSGTSAAGLVAAAPRRR